MAISNARSLALCQATLTMTGPPKGKATTDPGGTMTDAEAVAVLESEIAAAEGAAIDNDQRPFFRVFSVSGYEYGPYAELVVLMKARAVALAP